MLMVMMMIVVVVRLVMMRLVIDDGTNFLPARFAVQRKLNKFTMQCTKTNGIAGSRIYSAAKGLTKQRHKRCQSTARHIMSRSSSETVSHVAVSLANSFNL